MHSNIILHLARVKVFSFPNSLIHFYDFISYFSNPFWIQFDVINVLQNIKYLVNSPKSSTLKFLFAFKNHIYKL